MGISFLTVCRRNFLRGKVLKTGVPQKTHVTFWTLLGYWVFKSRITPPPNPPINDTTNLLGKTQEKRNSKRFLNCKYSRKPQEFWLAPGKWFQDHATLGCQKAGTVSRGWLGVMFFLLSQWLNFKLFGITYLVGKLSSNFFFQGPLAEWVFSGCR